MSDDDRRRRAEARRRTMTIRRTHVGDDVDPHPIHGADAISLATQLTRMAFGVAASTRPTYSRSEIPVRFAPRGRG